MMRRHPRPHGHSLAPQWSLFPPPGPVMSTQHSHVLPDRTGSTTTTTSALSEKFLTPRTSLGNLQTEDSDQNSRDQPQKSFEDSSPMTELTTSHFSTENLRVNLFTFEELSPIEEKNITFKVPDRKSKSQEERRQKREVSIMSASTIASPVAHSRGFSDSSSYESNATSLPALQVNNVAEDFDTLQPVKEEDIDPGSFDLVAPPDTTGGVYSLETRSELLFSTEHLRVIFDDPSLLLRFTSFLSTNRPSSIPILIYYLDAVKALKAISYSNAIAEALNPLRGCDFSRQSAKPTVNTELEEKAAQAFEVMVREDLPAYVVHVYIQTVSLSIQRRITGTLPSRLREASEGLAEVFCLTDPSRPDNPIVFASEEFHRTTQYGMNYVIGRNCRFLQGPKTNPSSVRRLREMIEAGKEHCEVFLNYRRDGSPFMNLLMCAPLSDSRGMVRYFIGAQVDVSGLVKECADLESLKRLVIKEENKANSRNSMENQNSSFSLKDLEAVQKDEFQELSEMLNMQELDTVRRWGGRMHKEKQEEVYETANGANWNKPRLLIHSGSPSEGRLEGANGSRILERPSGRLAGIYENYLLVRPYPSLRILFASPSLRVPGILQSPFMNKIGGSSRVSEELTQALADGRGVTAKVRWVSKTDAEGRNRWIHCTPLIGSNGAIGVWMVVLVDDENDGSRKFKQAPPVDPRFGKNFTTKEELPTPRESESLRGFALEHGGRDMSFGASPRKGLVEQQRAASTNGSQRTGSPYTLNLG